MMGRDHWRGQPRVPSGSKAGGEWAGGGKSKRDAKGRTRSMRAAEVTSGALSDPRYRTIDEYGLRPATAIKKARTGDQIGVDNAGVASGMYDVIAKASGSLTIRGWNPQASNAGQRVITKDTWPEARISVYGKRNT